MAAEQAVQHLHQLGHRRIGLLLGPSDHVPSQRKLDSAIHTFERLGIPFEEQLVVRGLYSLESGQAGATRLLGSGATAIVCASGPLALGAVRAAIDLLLAQISGRTDASDELLFEPELVLRASTGPAPRGREDP